MDSLGKRLADTPGGSAHKHFCLLTVESSAVPSIHGYAVEVDCLQVKAWTQSQGL
jgi:hypothetical protein